MAAQHAMTGHRLGVAEELSVTSGGSTVLADGSVSFGKTESTTTRGGHHHGGGGSLRGGQLGKRNLSVRSGGAARTRLGGGADRRGPSMAGYGRGQFSMIDTNDAAALDKAAAILANDDFLEAATMSLGSLGGAAGREYREYGAPSVLFSAPIRPNSPERGSRLSGSASMPGLSHGGSHGGSAGTGMPSNTTTQAASETGGGDNQLWAARTNRGDVNGNGMPPRGRGGVQSMSVLPSSKSASTKTDADAHHQTVKKKPTLQFGKGEAPLAVSRSLDGTWHQVGIVAAPYERPVTRREILALEHRYNAICDFARLALKEGGGGNNSGGGGKDTQQQDPTGFADLLEQELMNTKQELMHMFTPLTENGRASAQAIAAVTEMIPGGSLAEEGVDMQWRKPLTATIFEQKWTDMVLGELQEQIGVSCMEQGRLLFALRKRYAQAFNTMHDANRDMMERLAAARSQREHLGQTLVDTKAQLGIHEEQAEVEREQALEAKESELRLEIDGERKKAEEAKHQQQRTQETLRTLNGIFLQMQRDADGSTKADLRDALTTMERRLYEREKELTELRPMRAGHDEMTEKIRVQEQTIMELTKELQNAKDDVAQRDAMVAELMRQQGERLSQEELAKAKGGGGGGGGNAAASGGSASGATTAMGQPVPESAVRIEGLVKDVDKLLGGTVKKRLPCAGYRLLLLLPLLHLLHLLPLLPVGLPDFLSAPPARSPPARPVLPQSRLPRHVRIVPQQQDRRQRLPRPPDRPCPGRLGLVR